MAIREWSVEEVVREYRLEDLVKDLIGREEWFRKMVTEMIARDAMAEVEVYGGTFKQKELSLERLLKDMFGNESIVSHIGPQRRKW